MRDESCLQESSMWLGEITVQWGRVYECKGSQKDEDPKKADSKRKEGGIKPVKKRECE